MNFCNVVVKDYGMVELPPPPSALPSPQSPPNDVTHQFDFQQMLSVYWVKPNMYITLAVRPVAHSLCTPPSKRLAPLSSHSSCLYVNRDLTHSPSKSIKPLPSIDCEAYKGMKNNTLCFFYHLGKRSCEINGVT